MLRYLWNVIHRSTHSVLILNWRWIVVTLTRFLKGEL